MFFIFCLLLFSPLSFAKEYAFTGVLSGSKLQKYIDEGYTIRIKSSPGGVGAVAMMLKKAPKVIVDGRCDSACAWAFVVNEKACFTKRARFGFHAAHDPGTDRLMVPATDYWLEQVKPEALREK